MKHKDPSPSVPGRPRPGAQVWAPVLVLLLVPAVVWASFFSGPGPVGPSADPASSETADAPGATSSEPDAGEDGGRSDDGADDGRRRRAVTVTRRSPALPTVPRPRPRSTGPSSASAPPSDAWPSASRSSWRRAASPCPSGSASFNVLGDSHTGPGGNKPASYPDAGPRMDMAISMLRGNGIDVVGFQEFESTQHNMFTARAGEYSLYPGLSLGTKSVRFNIAWRSSMFRLVEAHTLPIPYAGGSRIEMPVVLLESTTTGRRAWFANFHNPADTPNLGNNARWRSMAAGMEIAHLTSLHAEDGTPVIVTGDFNERAEIFCRFTAGGVFSSASGGSTGAGCAPPASMQVDWVFGSTGVAFDGYAVTDAGRASDHAMVHSGATLTEGP